jgi:hypothetical protein
MTSVNNSLNPISKKVHFLLMGVLIIINPESSFAHDPAGTSAAWGWTIPITLIIAIAASSLSFRYFFRKARERGSDLRFITGALAIVIPLVVVCLSIPFIFVFVYWVIILQY